jgi:hypothetical protein
LREQELTYSSLCAKTAAARSPSKARADHFKFSIAEDQLGDVERETPKNRGWKARLVMPDSELRAVKLGRGVGVKTMCAIWPPAALSLATVGPSNDVNVH